MIEYYGNCPKCQFQYSVNDRAPHFCPECGEKLFKDYEEFTEIKSQKIEVCGLHATVEHSHTENE